MRKRQVVLVVVIILAAVFAGWFIPGNKTSKEDVATVAATQSPGPSNEPSESPSPTPEQSSETPSASPTPEQTLRVPTEKPSKTKLPITPSATPVPGGKYPWFFVPPGQLASVWGITGPVIYAGDFVSVISTGPAEAVVAVDSFSFRFATRFIGFDDVKITEQYNYTYVSFYCGGTEVSGATIGSYNISNTKPGALEITYYKEIRTIDVTESCPNK
jgi:hypothetical protein